MFPVNVRLFRRSGKQWKFVYFLVSKHNSKCKYQMIPKFIREERLSEGLENRQSENTFE